MRFLPVLSLLLPLTFCAGAQAQSSFSCSIGRPACLGFGDKVVDQNAQCFSGNTCMGGGFVCKSKLDDAVFEYDKLVKNYNDLVRKNRTLLDAAQEVVRKNSLATAEYDDLLDRNRRLAADLEDKKEQLRVMTENYNQLLAASTRPAPRKDAGKAADKKGQ